jgi:hypothetical protein
MQKAMQEEVRIKYSIADRFEEALEETDEELSDSKRVYNQTLKTSTIHTDISGNCSGRGCK